MAQRLEAETDPRRRHVLELVLAHMKRELRLDIEGVIDTLSDNPRYIIWPNADDPIAGRPITLDEIAPLESAEA